MCSMVVGCQESQYKISGHEKSISLHPYVAFSKDAGQIASPITSGPSETLLEEFGIIFKGGLDLAFGMILHVCFMAMIDHPAGDEIVIIGIELILTKPPLLVGEAVREVFVLQDAGAVGTSPSRDTGHASVHVGHGCAVKVSAFQVQSSKEVVDTLREARILCSPQSLTGHHTTILFLFKGGQDPWQQLGGPVNIVISKHNDFSGDFRDGTGHLPSLVGLLDRHASEMLARGWHLRDGSLSLFQIILHRDQDEFMGFVAHDSLDGSF